MSGLCKDCRYWETQEMYRIDRHAAIPGGWQACVWTEGGSEPRLPNSKAAAFDGDGFAAVLLTAPDFGCVQFEAKG